jgi:hypothetical protein
MKRSILVLWFGVAALMVALLPAVPQTAPATKAKKGPENLPWTRFHPATPPYQPTDGEKQQIQAKTDQLGGVIRELRSRRVDDAIF